MKNIAYTETAPKDRIPLFMSFLVDLIISFAGTSIWLYFLLVTLGGIVSYNYFPLLMSISIIIINFVFVFPSLFFLWRKPGSSVGRLLFGYTLVNIDESRPSIIKLLIHDVLLHSILYIILFNFTSGFLLIVVVLAQSMLYVVPTKQPILSLITGTKFIRSNDTEKIQQWFYGPGE